MSHFKFNTFKGHAWDSESLKRTLVRDYPGAKTLQEAVSMAKSKPAQVIEPKLEEKKENPLTELYRTAVSEIEKVYDPLANYCPETVKELATKPLKTSQDVISWRDRWLDLIRSHSDDSERF